METSLGGAPVRLDDKEKREFAGGSTDEKIALMQPDASSFETAIFAIFCAALILQAQLFRFLPRPYCSSH